MPQRIRVQPRVRHGCHLESCTLELAREDIVVFVTNHANSNALCALAKIHPLHGTIGDLNPDLGFVDQPNWNRELALTTAYINLHHMIGERLRLKREGFCLIPQKGGGGGFVIVTCNTAQQRPILPSWTSGGK